MLLSMRLAGVTCHGGASRRPNPTDNITARCLGRRFPAARSAGRFVATRGDTGDKGDNTRLAPKVNTPLPNRSPFREPKSTTRCQPGSLFCREGTAHQVSLGLRGPD